MTEKKVIETQYGWYQKNDDKVNVDEIIGIVKTDGQTNSVQLKKEAQLSICEKRLIELEKENEQLKKDGLYWGKTAEARKKEIDRLQKENQSWLKTASHMDMIHHEDREYCERLYKENKDLREQLILANAFIKMIENCYEDASIEDILYMKYGEFQEELHLQIAIAKEEL